jgi:hypothetical protein
MGVDLTCLQKPKEKENDQAKLKFTTDNAAVFAAVGAGDCEVAGGTAWLWARPDAFEAVDVLVVDEAAQMSLANGCIRTSALLPPSSSTKAASIPNPGSSCRKSAVTLPWKGRGCASRWSCTRATRAPRRKKRTWCAICTGHSSRQGRPGSTVGETNSRSRPGISSSSPPIMPRSSSCRTAYRARGSAPSTQEAPIVIYSMTTSSHADAPRGMEFLYSLNRLNVATSRAKCVCVLVASPAVLEADCRTPRQMQLANAYCRYLVRAGGPQLVSNSKSMERGAGFGSDHMKDSHHVGCAAIVGSGDM